MGSNNGFMLTRRLKRNGGRSRAYQWHIVLDIIYVLHYKRKSRRNLSTRRYPDVPIYINFKTSKIKEKKLFLSENIETERVENVLKQFSNFASSSPTISYIVISKLCNTISIGIIPLKRENIIQWYLFCYLKIQIVKF